MATQVMTITDFRNEPLTDFSDPENERRMREALDQVRSELGRSYPLILGDREVHEGKLADSVNPARPEQVIGRFVQGTVEHVEEAMTTASEAFESWKRRSWEERADVVLRAADVMRTRKFELAALLVYEVSKS
ncbi:MAG: aldehyde dehydrogenase family protein, partial [Longimicrobiales bacterium]